MRRLVVGLVVACNGAAGDETSSTSDATTTTGAPTGGAASWATWTRMPERLFRGQIFDESSWLASDPCVLKDEAGYRMFYTCVAGAAVGGLCGVQSVDGVEWAPLPSIDPAIDGLIVRARPGEGWDENMETCAVRRDGAGLELVYAGYPQVDEHGMRGPAGLGVLRSEDGVVFVREPDAPVLVATPGGRDGDDIFSPTFVAEDGALEVVYVGYCIDGYHDELACDAPAIQLLGARRDADGVWTKRDEGVLGPRADVAWLQDGAAEPDLIRGSDGLYYLFVTGGLGDEPRVTGLAVGPTAFGPWQIAPTPIVVGEAGSFDACGALAPSVVIDGDTVRMWYLGIDDCDGACASCDHAACGCEARFSIGYAEASWPLYSEG